MPDFDVSRIPSMTDAELAAFEADTTAPLDFWTAVEAERGRRNRAGGASGGPASPVARSPAPPAPPAPPAAAVGHGVAGAPAVNLPGADDPRLQSAMQLLSGLLVPGERLLAYAVQRRLFALLHRRVIVAATTGRAIIMTRGLFGGYTPADVRWQDLKDANVRAGVFGATLSIASLVSGDLGSQEHVGGVAVVGGLQKDAAQQVYTIAQSQEQAWREKRRVRDLDELRAQSGGIQFGAGGAGGAAAMAGALAGGDPTDRLRRAKEMMDSGLITDAEYESIKARVVEAL